MPSSRMNESGNHFMAMRVLAAIAVLDSQIAKLATRRYDRVKGQTRG